MGIGSDSERWSTETTLDDLLHDIYALEEEMHAYERKYGVLSETFYES